MPFSFKVYTLKRATKNSFVIKNTNPIAKSVFDNYKAGIKEAEKRYVIKLDFFLYNI